MVGIGRLFGLGAATPKVRHEPTVSMAGETKESDFQHPSREFLTGWGSGTASGQVVSEKTTLSLPAVMQALRILCGVFAMTPLVYYRRSGTAGKDRADQTPAYRLFHDNPNQVQTPFGFKELMLADVLLAGNFYAYASRDWRMDPVALTRLEPLQVDPAFSFDRQAGVTAFYDATLPDGTRERFAPRDVWHVAGFGRNGLFGLNPLRYMREAIGGALGTQDFATRFWGNDAKPSVVLTTKQKVPPEVKTQIKDDWNSRFAGSGRSHGVAVLDQELEPKFLSHDNEKNQFLETRTFQVLDVARCFGVPPHLIFELSKATFSNIEHQSLEFVTFHMMPHYTRVAEAATKAFAADGHFFEFLPEALLKGDVKARWEAYRAAREMGVLSADEIRSRENMNAIGGSVGGSYLWPANMNQAGAQQKE